MNVIYKYPFEVSDTIEFEFPGDAEILCIQMQNNTPCLWVRCENTQPSQRYQIHIRGTGHNADGLGKYISTFQMAEGRLVFHAFESQRGRI